MQHTNNPASKKQAAGAALSSGEAIMKSTLLAVLTLLGMTGMATAAAKEPLPDAPSAIAATGADPFIVEASPVAATSPKLAETKVVDLKFTSLAIVSAGSTFADSYTTLFARENWLAGKKNVCNEEVESAYLYGTHPTVGRAYAVASVKTATSIFAAYYLRKHHSKFWSLPLITNSAISLQGVTQNMITCN
jgi:hypothetical protein